MEQRGVLKRPPPQSPPERPEVEYGEDVAGASLADARRFGPHTRGPQARGKPHGQSTGAHAVAPEAWPCGVWGTAPPSAEMRKFSM